MDDMVLLPRSDVSVKFEWRRYGLDVVGVVWLLQLHLPLLFTDCDSDVSNLTHWYWFLPVITWWRIWPIPKKRSPWYLYNICHYLILILTSPIVRIRSLSKFVSGISWCWNWCCKLLCLFDLYLFLLLLCLANVYLCVLTGTT